MRQTIFSFIATAILLLSATTALAQRVYEKRTGVIVADYDTTMRAMEVFGGTATGGTWYSDVVNEYKRELGDSVRVYSMIIPTAVAFYCPESAEHLTKPERPTIENMYAHMSDSITTVDIWDTLAAHTTEPIYARTDHHWLPLGAYYAAKVFAKAAGVPFRDLSDYDEHVVHNFVGSMRRFSGEQRLREFPEEFVYYTPRNCEYTTTYVEHILGKGNRVVGLKPQYEGEFFRHFPDGNSSAYCTFMGGDIRTTHVATPAHNGRRLLIIKDSYGNALPGYLFFSFEDIYVTDFRYFTRNMADYIREHHVTDLLFANNIKHAYNRNTARKLTELLRGHKSTDNK